MLGAALVASIIAGGIYSFQRAPLPQPMAFSEFLKAVDGGQVTAVTLTNSQLDVILRDGTAVRTVAPPEFLANAAFVTDLYRRQIRVDVTPAPEPGALSWSAIAHDRRLPRPADLHRLSDHGRAHPVHLGPGPRRREGGRGHHVPGRRRRR